MWFVHAWLWLCAVSWPCLLSRLRLDLPSTSSWPSVRTSRCFFRNPMYSILLAHLAYNASLTCSTVCVGSCYGFVTVSGQPAPWNVASILFTLHLACLEFLAISMLMGGIACHATKWFICTNQCHDLRGSLCKVLRHYLGGSLNAAQIALKTDNGSI